MPTYEVIFTTTAEHAVRVPVNEPIDLSDPDEVETLVGMAGRRPAPRLCVHCSGKVELGDWEAYHSSGRLLYVPELVED